MSTIANPDVKSESKFLKIVVSISFKNGRDITLKANATCDELSNIMSMVSECMKNPTVHGYITIGGAIINLNEIVYFKVDDIASEDENGTEEKEEE